MGSCSALNEPINQFALVTYLPGELGCYLDQLRRELVSQCNARSHISLLPPRSLQLPSYIASSQIETMCLKIQPFVVKIADLSVFPKTSVIYLEVEEGQQELENLHRSFNSGALAFDEPYTFHPHITLAQNFEALAVEERLEQARLAWKAYSGPREFLLDRVVFVQNSSNNCWTDLKSFALRSFPAAPSLAALPEFSRTY